MKEKVKEAVRKIEGLGSEEAYRFDIVFDDIRLMSFPASVERDTIIGIIDLRMDDKKYKSIKLTVMDADMKSLKTEILRCRS